MTQTAKTWLRSLCNRALGASIFGLLIICAGATLGESEPQPIFYAPFDGTASPALAEGDATPHINGAPTYQLGKKGQAVLIEGDGSIAYASEGNLDIRQGTIAFWVKPVVPMPQRDDWDRFFDMTYGVGNNDSIRLLCARDDGRVYAALNSGGEPYHVGPARDDIWPGAQWHHVALTWGPGGSALYFDGIQVGVKAEYSPPRGLDKFFYLGNDKSAERSAKALIDELHIYDSPLPAGHIRELAGLPPYTHAGHPNLLKNSSFECGRTGLRLVWHADETTRWFLDEQEACHGHQSLRLDRTGSAPPNAPPFHIYGPWLQLISGRHFTFSVYAKTDRPGMSIRLCIRHATKHHLLEQGLTPLHPKYESFTLSTEWERYHTTVQLPLCYKDAARVEMQIRGQGLVWLDALQLEPGEIKAYQPLQEIEIAAEADRYGSLYDLAEHVGLKIAVFNNGTADAPVTVSYSLLGPRGRSMLSGTRRPVVRSKATDTFALPPFQPKLCGQYQLGVSMLDKEGKAIDSCKTAFAVVRSHTDLPVPASCPIGIFGAHGNMRFELPRYRMVGLKYFRPGIGLTWARVEKEKGTFDYGERNLHYMKVYRRNGFSVIPTLFSTPKWAFRKDKEVPKWRTGRIPPENLRDFYDYCYRVVSDWKGRGVKSWEVWNEPNARTFWSGTIPEYVELLKVGYRACKDADPDCTVAGICMAGLRDRTLELFEECFKLGALDYMDVLSYHPYCDSPELSGLAEKMQKLNVLMERYGQVKPHYFTEYGTGGADDEPYWMPWFAGGTPIWNEEQQAAIYAQTAILSLANGCRLLCWFLWDPGDSTHGPFHTAWERPDSEYTPKKVMVAANNLSWELGDVQLSRELAMPENGQYGFEFKRKQDYLTILWDIDEPQEVQISDCPPGIKITDMYGNAVAVPETGSHARLPLDFNPIFVSLPVPFPAVTPAKVER